MLLLLIPSMAVVLSVSCGTKEKSAALALTPYDSIAEHSPSVFLVMYDGEVGKEPLLKAISEYGCEIIYDYHIINGMALKKPDVKTLEETMAYFKKVKGVLTVEYDHIYHLTDPVCPKGEIQ